MKYVKSQELRNNLIERLIAENVPQGHAETIADVLVYADASGIGSHGTIRFEHYINRIKNKGINLESSYPVYDGKYEWGKLLDAQGGFGHVAALKAVSLGVETAKKQGLSIVSVKNTSHCGALSYYMRKITGQGFIGFCLANTDKCVVPSGGKKAFLGTNPIAWGFPQSDNDEPVIADMATSEGAFGKIIAAKSKGGKIPKNWAVDKEGRPTDDPDKAENLVYMSSHKGYAIACVVEILSAILTGSAFGPHVVPMYSDLNKTRDLSAFFLVLDPGVHVSSDVFKEKLAQMVKELHCEPTAEEGKRIFVPGEPETLKFKEALKNGVPILDDVGEYLGY